MIRTDDFDYTLPQELIAQEPIEPRHASRLMVMDRDQDTLEHTTFWHVGDYLRPGDLLVINESRVIPARLHARKPTGGRVELLLLRKMDGEGEVWQALIGGKGVKTGTLLQVENGPQAQLLEAEDGARRLVRFVEPLEPYLPQVGEMPLPPYIHQPLRDPERYQTVYARVEGSAAAPTAGLHFTPELMTHLETQGLKFARVVLHVGLDTFAPVHEDDAQQHEIHHEWCEVPEETAHLINETKRKGGRVVAVGTTVVRTLETGAQKALDGNSVGPFIGDTGLYILPGYSFKVIDALVTNFHLPRSTLLMLVSAFAGRERVLAAYEEAVRLHYRFYSFGDAMLIL